MSRQDKMTLAVLAGAIVIAFLIVILRPSPKEMPRDERAPLVQTVPLNVSQEPLTVLGSGTVQPEEEVTVSAQVSGRIVYVNPAFREGKMIRAGSTLLRIESAEYSNRVRAAQADVAAQDVAVLQANEEARIARDELTRFAYRQNASDQPIGGNGLSARILAPRELTEEPQGSADTDHTQPPMQLATREPQLRSAKAARERAAAMLADARLSLDRTRVKAPFTGLVRSESAAIGKLVQPGQELGAIVSTSSYEVRVAFTQREAALIPNLMNTRSKRMPAAVFLDYGRQTYRWSAYVDRADSILDPKTRTIDVFLRVPDPLRGGVNTAAGANGKAPPLLMGSFVRAEIEGGSSEKYLRVPVEALRSGNAIWTVHSGRLRIVPVRVLQRSDEIAYVVPLASNAGKHVITSPLRAPVNGMKVRMAQSSGKPAQTNAAPAEAQNAQAQNND